MTWKAAEKQVGVCDKQTPETREITRKDGYGIKAPASLGDGGAVQSFSCGGAACGFTVKCLYKSMGLLII